MIKAAWIIVVSLSLVLASILIYGKPTERLVEQRLVEHEAARRVPYAEWAIYDTVTGKTTEEHKYYTHESVCGSSETQTVIEGEK